MPREDRFNKVYASDAQIRSTQDDIKHLEGMLRQDQGRGDRRKIADEGEILKEIREKKGLLEQHTPQKLKGQKANHAYAEAKELAREIKEAMPTGRAYKQPYPGKSTSHKKESDFENTVRQQMAFQTDKKLKRAQKRYKAIMSNLDPDDPRARSIEGLRR